MVDIDDSNTIITTHGLSDSNWILYSSHELLNSNRTKFFSSSKCKNGERYILLYFNKPIEICAIGIRSAGDFPHLDPKNITVST